MRFAFISAPSWFLAPDVVINVFSFLILLTFFILCIKSYKLNKNKGIFYLGVGFASIALGQLAITMTKFVLYYHTTVAGAIGNAIIKYNIVSSVNVVYNLSIFLNGLFTLIGLYVIYRLPQKEKSIKDLSFNFILRTPLYIYQQRYLLHIPYIRADAVLANLL